MTPFEAWNGIKPNVSHLKTFGSICYSHIPKDERKKLDLIVANNVSLPEVGFAHDTNEVTIIGEDAKWTLPLSDKRTIADGILDAIVEIRQGRSSENK